MDDKKARVYWYLTLAVLNFGLILWVLSPLTTVTRWVLGGLLLGAGIEDLLTFAWSFGHVKSAGLTSEVSVAAIWAGGQILQVLVLAGFVFINFGVVGFLVMLLLFGWMKIRISTLNKVMDLRYWDVRLS